ncbi:MAG: 16S rRNA (guanine(527)-N(7))-methyltransferase RsmG [Flavobacteriales bacterium]|nr:16S rRNA (guanine(527)-N(7))-methyltransferase RsmG [Flavobacteriales bacterium]
MALSDDANLLLKYFPNLSKDQIAQFEKMGNMYREWNNQINVISRKDIDFLFERHILHSLSIYRTGTFVEGTSFLDVGTGGGIPGLPLAIVMPHCKFHLIDARGKKIKVVNELIEQLGLKNVTAEHIRAEDVKKQYTYVLGRGVTNFVDFYELVRRRIKKGGKNEIPNGIIYLKGGDFDTELKKLGNVLIQEWNLSEIFEQEFFETKKIISVKV